MSLLKEGLSYKKWFGYCCLWRKKADRKKEVILMKKQWSLKKTLNDKPKLLEVLFINEHFMCTPFFSFVA